MGAAPGIVALAFFTCACTLFACGMEIVRVYQTVTRAQDRYQAYVGQNLGVFDAAYESTYFLPGTDIPLQPAAIGTLPLLRVVNALVLFVIGLTEFPATKFFVDSLGGYLLIFSPDVSIWYVGLLQSYLGITFVAFLAAYPKGSPLGLDEDTVTWARYVAGWLLVASGLINILLGFLYGPAVRVFRGQASESSSPPPVLVGVANNAVKLAWPACRATISTIVGSNVNLSAYTQAMAEMDAAVAALA